MSHDATDDALPLAGLRVIDVGTRTSAPFCAGLLGEMGAEVIKVEDPRGGDFLRSIGPFAPDTSASGDSDSDSDSDDYSMWWAVEGRGRRGAALDLRRPAGQDLFRRLAATADVVCENFRPGTMERWGIGPANCDRRLVWALTGVFAAEAVVSMLYRRDRPDGTGRGGVTDAPLYGSILRILEWTVAAQDRLGITRGPEGNRMVTSAPIDNFPTADGRHVCIVAGADVNFRRLCAAMGRPELATDQRWSSPARRAEHGAEINDLVAAWTFTSTAAEVEAACLTHEVPVGTAYTAADMLSDPHFEAGGDFVTIHDPVAGAHRQQAPYPRIDGVRPVAPSPAPTLGQHNDEVWGQLIGLSADDLAHHRAERTI